jgi:hypothetical protein
MGVELRYSTANEYDRISQCLHEHWANNHVYCRDQKLFDWTFHRATHWPADQYSFALAEDGGELVGILGGIPFTFNHYGKESLAIWLANYVIAPSHRKGTAALQLLSMFRKPEFHPTVAFGINPATATIYKVLRGIVLPEIPRHFLVLPEQEERMRNVLSIAYPDLDGATASELTRAFVLPRLPEVQPFAQTIPEQWDVVDWADLSKETVGAARNFEYLKWRYLDHPVFAYRVIAVPDGSRTGLAIWRCETIRRKTEEGRADVDRIGRLVEFLPASPLNGEHLWAAFLADARAEDCFAADYYGFHGATRQMLEAQGFRETSTVPGSNKIPTRFQPLDGKGGGILSAMFIQPGAPACDLSADCPWLWTKADSDQDRPN